MENVQEKSLFDDLVSFDEPINLEADEQVETDRDENIDNSDIQTDEVEDREEDTNETDESVSEDNSEETDDRVEALYELLIENRVIAKQKDFKPTLDNLQGVLENLPEQYFLKAAEALHPDAREVAKALFYLGENATKDEIIKMLDSDYTPSIDLDDEVHKECDDAKIPNRAISLMWNQRSVDVPLGLPFNIASYGLLLEIIAKSVNMVPEELIGNLGDCHIYNNQIDGVKEQITRKPYKLPTLKHMKTDEFYKSLSEDLSLITHLDNTDFVIENYESHPTIKMPLSN